MPDPPPVDALYALMPEEFVAARTTFAKHLRAQGDRSGAEAAARLRRPTVSAWALNQVARSAPALIDDLLEAGAALRRAMTNAMTGDGSGLHRAETDERVAIDGIVSSATAIADTGGRSLTDLHRQRMVATLRAAVLDDDVACLLRDGMLDADHEAPPFGFAPVPESAETINQATNRKPARPDAVSAARERARNAELARLRSESDRLARQAQLLNGNAVDAERRAAELRRKANEAADAAVVAIEKLAAAQA